MKKQVTLIYQRLFSAFGRQYWWPASDPFEVMVGAILTQNTNWLNVERAIKNLKNANVLDPVKLYKISTRRLAKLIRPAGYFNIKSKRLKEFLKFFFKKYRGSLREMAANESELLREQLLSVNGIGPETADSILLYALNKPVFVVDAYTRRILFRHYCFDEGLTYGEIQNLFMQNLQKDVKLFNEYHALLVKLGKDFCLKSKPRCQICPLENLQRRVNA
ncbi:MAG: endonuclease III domain-containing protein [Candidatus Omnitrophota bacterium]